MKDSNAAIYEIVTSVPAGSVVTYGQIARALGMPNGARQVGWAMHRCPEGCPWHRVINSRGKVSLSNPLGALQRSLLEDEGLAFMDGRVDLAEYAWEIPPHEG
jgi:methylated-DNA-protein-cysteine methyltransferase related protein